MKILTFLPKFFILLAIPMFVTGQCWSLQNGTDAGVSCIYHDSIQDHMFVGGGFQNAGDEQLNHCGFWSDSSFQHMGTDVAGTNDSVWCFVHFNGDLYVGGSFTTAGGSSANRIARWDGSAWHPVGEGFDGTVRALCVYDGHLYAGGQFAFSGGTGVNHLGMWDNGQWVEVGGGMNGPVYSMTVYDGQLCLGGSFDQAGGLDFNNICAWDGDGFNGFGTGINHHGMMGQTGAFSLCVYDGALYCGGRFNEAGGAGMHNMSQWDGNGWNSIGDVGGGMMSNGVSTMCVFDGSMYVGGNFGSCGSRAANNIGVWDGSTWSTIGTGMNGRVRAMAVYNGQLYIGGAFTDAAGTDVNNIAGYSPGTTGFHPVGVREFGLQVYPSPASTEIHCRWVQKRADKVIIELFGTSGRKLMEKELGHLNAGEQTATVDVSKLQQGWYFVTIQLANERSSRQILLIK